MRKAVAWTLGIVGSFWELMVQVPATDASTNFCSWLHFWPACKVALSGWVEPWGWLVPSTLLFAAVLLFAWPIVLFLFRRLERAFFPRGDMPLPDALRWFWERLRKIPKYAEYVAHYEDKPATMMKKIAQMAFHHTLPAIPLYGISPPRTALDQVPADHVGGWEFSDDATELFDKWWDSGRRWTDLRIRRADIKSRLKTMRRTEQTEPPIADIQDIPASPLEIIFDRFNPHRHFWSVEQKIEDGKVIATYWEFRALIKNNSSKTIKNVRVEVEVTGIQPTRPEFSVFDINKKSTIDLNPGGGAFVVIRTWPARHIFEGMMSGPDCYGPIKMTASGDDVPGATKLFHFDPERKPSMIYE